MVDYAAKPGESIDLPYSIAKDLVEGGFAYCDTIVNEDITEEISKEEPKLAISFEDCTDEELIKYRDDAKLSKLLKKRESIIKALEKEAYRL